MCKSHDRTGSSCPLISFFKYCFSSLIWAFSTLFLGLIFLFSSRIHCNISRCCSEDTIGLGGGGGGTLSWDGVFVGAIMVEGACWGVSCGFAIWASGSVSGAFSVVCGFGFLPNNTYAASSKWLYYNDDVQGDRLCSPTVCHIIFQTWQQYHTWRPEESGMTQSLLLSMVERILTPRLPHLRGWRLSSLHEKVVWSSQGLNPRHPPFSMEIGLSTSPYFSWVGYCKYGKVVNWTHNHEMLWPFHSWKSHDTEIHAHSKKEYKP